MMMRQVYLLGFVPSLIALAMAFPCSSVSANETALPPPTLDGSVCVEKALATRTTARSYSPEPLTLAQVAQLLRAGNANRNLLLQARAMGLQTNTVGGLRDSEISSVLGLPPDVTPVVIVTFGNKLNR